MAPAAANRVSKPLPPPLPPAERTAGQLVGETLRLYGRRFWLVLPLGLSVAALDAVATGRDVVGSNLVLWLGSPLVTLSYVAACALVAEARPTRRAALTALAAGVLVFAPVPLLVQLYALPAVAWLGWFGFAVPAALLERRGFVASVRRSGALARADYVHAVGSLATLILAYVVARFMLAFLLRSQSGQTERIAAFLADLVISPILFVGAALLYVDQEARVASRAAKLPDGRSG